MSATYDSESTGLRDAIKAVCDDLAASSACSAAYLEFIRAIAHASDRIDRLFALPTIDAPGAHLIAGVFSGSARHGTGQPAPSKYSATGKGLDRTAALISCIGEAAEFLSTDADPAESLVPTTAIDIGTSSPEHSDQLLAWAGIAPDQHGLTVDGIRVSRVTDDTTTVVPANICFRGLHKDRNPEPVIKIGSGCGVGVSAGEARLHGLLEWVERDAVALWWLGGRRAAPINNQLAAVADEVLATLRAGSQGRQTWILDLTTEFGIPCIAALSCNDENHGLACGFAARLSAQDAIKAALLEMCQTEMAIHVVQMKRVQAGDSSLSPADWAHLRRHFDLKVDATDLLAPSAESFKHIKVPTDKSASELAVWLATELERDGLVAVYGLDVTREDLGIAAQRVLAPGLQPMSPSVQSPRLAAQILATGGGPGLNGGVELI